MQEAEDKKKLLRREELEQIQLRKAADEVFRRNEMEKSDRNWEEKRKLTEFLFAQMVCSIVKLFKEDFGETKNFVSKCFVIYCPSV
jgi:hypothetical protein